MPPRDPLPPSWSPKNTNISDDPIIRPIIRDGQQLSETHYWLLPDKERATHKPPTYDPTHSQMYTNLGNFQQTNPVFEDSPQPSNKAQFFPGAWNPSQFGSEKSAWGEATGMTAVGGEKDDVYDCPPRYDIHPPEGGTWSDGGGESLRLVITLK